MEYIEIGWNFMGDIALAEKRLLLRQHLELLPRNSNTGTQIN